MHKIIQSLDSFFKISERKSNFQTEILAGVTTFLAMAYIIFVNPAVLGDAGMSTQGVFLATALAAALTTLFMGLYAKLPIALAPGMGVNAFFAYTVVLTMGYTWQEALAAVLVSGLLFFIIAATGLRSIIIKAIPSSLKHAIGAGIGFFIAFIGLKNAGIIVANPATLVGLGNLADPLVLLAVFGVIVTFVLLALKVKAGVFYGLVITAVVGVVASLIWGTAGLPSLPATFPLAWPTFDGLFGAAFGALGGILTSLKGWLAIFTFLFIDFFDTAGTFMAVGNQLSIKDKNGDLEGYEKAMIVDASGTIFGAVIGTSTVTSYIESSAGIGVGGRTGLTAVVTGVLFLLAIFLSPLLSLVTSAVTAAALIVVGSMMAASLSEINWKDWPIAVASFMTIIVMMLAYSISEGIGFGFITYTVVMLAAGRRKEIHPVFLGIVVLFLAHYILPLIIG